MVKDDREEKVGSSQKEAEQVATRRWAEASAKSKVWHSQVRTVDSGHGG